ncbi:MAG: hypothetical protein R3B84_19895 [Zavarzinella sp.]
MEATFLPNAERRKQVRLRTRSDLVITPQRYEGKWCQVVKDPVALKYFRFNKHEYYVFSRLNGENTLEDIRTGFEKEYAPDRLKLEEIEGFVRQLVTAGLVQHQSPNAARELFEKQRKQRRTKKLAGITNILYMKIPVFDPDRLLNFMIRYTRWIFTKTFLWLSVMLMISAALFVAFHYKTFYEKLPAYHEFFAFRTMLYMWLALGVVKVIHEFGHGLSCKAFDGECHQMGFLFMCFSPALYCNVTDSWTVADKWKRIIISFAGIWVELIIASIATFVWWYTPHWPFVNNVAMCLMVLCSVSTFLFNANPLMRFDGYYILADWLEVPNLRERANRYLGNVFKATAFGIEVPPEQYMAPRRKVLFVVFAIASWVYRWVLTISILLFLSGWLKPYKLENLSILLAFFALASMTVWPVVKMVKGFRQRGRLPDMKRPRVIITLLIFTGMVAAFFFLPLPVARVREAGLVQIEEGYAEKVHSLETAVLTEVLVKDGEYVRENQDLARFRNLDREMQLDSAVKSEEAAREMMQQLTTRLRATNDLRARISLEQELKKAEASWNDARTNRVGLEQLIKEVTVLKAPRAGVVMGVPKQEDIYRTWVVGESPPFCTIGDIKHLRLVVPVDSTDYLEIKRNLALAKQNHPQTPWIDVDILPNYQHDRRLKGRVTEAGIPLVDQKNIPIALTNRGGGPLATKPGGDPNVNEPLVQTYLIRVEVDDPYNCLVPGTRTTAKMNLQWRSAAWWSWRAITSALDLGLW